MLSADFNRDGTRIVTGSNDRIFRVWDAASGSPLQELQGHQNPVVTVDFSPDGTRFVAGSLYEPIPIRVWENETGRLVLELKGSTSTAKCVRFTPDGSRIVTTSSDQAIRIWNASTGEELLQIKCPETLSVGQIAVSPDGHSLFCAGDVIRCLDARPPGKPGEAPDAAELGRREWMERMRQEDLKAALERKN